LVAAPPAEGAHAREQLLDLEGLDQVVVGAGVEPGDALRGGIARAQHQHRREAAAGARAAQHLEAVQARQPQVEHHQVELGVLQGGERLRARAHPFHGVARAGQRVVDAGAEELVVLDQKDSHLRREYLNRSWRESP